MGPFIDPATVLAMLLMLLNGGVRDLASCVSTDTYWHARNVTVSADQLIRELATTAPADVPKLIGDLDADDPRTRDEAARKLAEYGDAAVPALKEAAKSKSPEVITRSNALLARIRGNKSAAVRRLMAIRTLGERNEAAALPVLRTLLDSKELFEAEYAAAAIAKIEGKPFNIPVATDAERAADVALLPSRLDLVAQAAPEIDGAFSIEKVIDALPMKQAQKDEKRETSAKAILSALDAVGNVRLNSITWGFYAAPPGVPGNTVFITRGLFDRSAMSAFLEKSYPNHKRANDLDIFQRDDDSAILLANDGRIIYLAREGGGELGLDAMTAALQKGAGDFSTNPDLPGLIKSLDTKAPLWMAVKMAAGLKEISGPFGEFDTTTLVAKQSLDKGAVVTDVRVQSVSSDATKVPALVDNYTRELKRVVGEFRQEEKSEPMLKPLADTIEGIKLQADGDKAIMTGTMRDMSALSGAMYMSTREEMVFPNPPPR